MSDWNWMEKFQNLYDLETILINFASRFICDIFDFKLFPSRLTKKLKNSVNLS